MSDSPPRPDAGGSPPRDAGTQALIERVRGTLLARIAADDTRGQRTVRADDSPWQPLLPGVVFRLLHDGGDTVSYLLRLDAGASVPAHRHPRDEECMVLAGDLRIGSLVLHGGDFHLAPAGGVHATAVSETGATLMLRGAPPDPTHFL